MDTALFTGDIAGHLAQSPTFPSLIPTCKQPSPLAIPVCHRVKFVGCWVPSFWLCKLAAFMIPTHSASCRGWRFPGDETESGESQTHTLFMNENSFQDLRLDNRNLRNEPCPLTYRTLLENQVNEVSS